MKTHSDRARDFFYEGYNCTQAVAAAFCDEMGLDRDAVLRMASSFGGGMGRMREVCGAVSGMFLVAGYFYGYDDPKASSEKKEHYARIQELAKEFRKENGSIICRELLGTAGRDTTPVPQKRTQDYYKKRPCPELVAYAAGLMEQYMEKHNKKNLRCQGPGGRASVQEKMLIKQGE